MNGAQLIGLVAVLIPMVAIITHFLRKWQEMDLKAARNLADTRRRLRVFDEVERRVADIETYVTSREYQLNRELGALKRRN